VAGTLLVPVADADNLECHRYPFQDAISSSSVVPCVNVRARSWSAWSGSPAVPVVVSTVQHVRSTAVAFNDACLQHSFRGHTAGHGGIDSV
jgi:hypothetical protein